MVESNAFVIFRNKCWILNVRGLIKKVVTDCLHCRKASATSNPPFMADISEERLQHNNKPLTNMGTDYFASFSIKLSKGSRSNAAKEKRYRVTSHVWPCAVHLKILNGLSIGSSYYYSKDM